VNITGINQNSPSFGILRVPKYSSTEGKIINRGQDIIEYIDEFDRQDFVKSGIEIVDGTAREVTFIMTRAHTKFQEIVKSALVALGGEEITSIKELDAKQAILNFERQKTKKSYWRNSL